MKSKQFDTFLRLETADGTALANDDDGGGHPDARLEFTPPAAGDCRVVAMAFRQGATGAFTLTVHPRR
jgi:hypothetical protein